MVIHIKTGMEHAKSDNLYNATLECFTKAFASRGMTLPNSFWKNVDDQSVAYLILSVEGKDEVNGALLGMYMSDPQFRQYGLEKVVRLDKIGVTPEKQGNGVMSGLLFGASDISFDRNGKKYPGILRTGDEQASEKYRKRSDAQERINGYDIHGFGFAGYEPAAFTLASKLVAQRPSDFQRRA